MAAWFNKKTARAMAKMAESLKAESRARAEAEEKLRAEIETKAAIERKVKAEAEKMLLAQFNKYSVLVERAEAKANEAMATAGAQVQEAEEKVLSYEAALARAEEKLSQAQRQFKAESLAREEVEEKLKFESEERNRVEAQLEDSIAAAEAKAEEKLKSEIEQRKRIEVQLKDAIAAAEAKAEEKVQSYEVALTETQEKLSEAKEQFKAEAFARVKAEEKVQSYEAALTKAQTKLIEAKGQVKQKAIAKAKEGPKAGIKERQRFFEQPEEGVYTLGRIRRHVFHPGNIKRKFVLLLVLAIFSALTFALSVANDPPVTEPGGRVIQGTTPERVSLVGSDIDREQLNSDVAADPSLGSLDGPAPGMTNAPPSNYESSDNIAFKADEEKSVPVSDTQLLTITANPEPLKITASASGKNNIVQLSDDNRLETRAGSSIYYEFSDVSIPANASIRSAVLFVEHFEEERFAEGKLEWAIGTGWPGRPAVWDAMKAPVHEGESSEAVDAWDITSVVDTVEKINSLQLQIKNNNDVANGKTLVDYAYVVVEYH